MASHLQQGVEGYLDGSGVATRVGHQSGGFHLLAVNLRQSIDCLFLQLWSLVFATVPTLAYFSALQGTYHVPMQAIAGAPKVSRQPVTLMQVLGEVVALPSVPSLHTYCERAQAMFYLSCVCETHPLY